MKRVTGRQLLRGLQYVENELARPGLSEQRRAQLERQLASYRERTRNLCLRCGRELEDLDSIATRLGPECRNKVIRLADDESPVSHRDDLHDAGWDDVTPDQVAFG